MLQSIAPERLGNKEGPQRDTWTSLGRESKRDLLSKLEAGGDENMRDQIGGTIEGEINERDVLMRDHPAIFPTCEKEF